MAFCVRMAIDFGSKWHTYTKHKYPMFDGRAEQGKSVGRCDVGKTRKKLLMIK